jgi:hypothetical protein
MWKSGNNLVELSDCIQKDINEIMEWNRKWKININADKTEYCIISKLKQHHGHTIFKLNNKILKYNRNSKLLGVRDRPFNLKGGGYDFLFRSEFFFRQHKLEFFFFFVAQYFSRNKH